MKKLIALLVILCLLLSLAACADPVDPAPDDPLPSDPAPSDPAPSDPTPSDPSPSDPTPSTPVVDPGLVFEKNADGQGYTVTFYTGSATTLAIPAQYEGLPVTAIAEGAFYENETLMSVTIPNSVTSIGAYAFAGCMALTSVTLPTGITVIEEGVFTYSALVSVVLPDSVERIGEYAFAGSSLVSVTLGSGLTQIDSEAFYMCNKLIEVINRSELAISQGPSNGYVALYAKTVHSGETRIENLNGYLFYNDATDGALLVGYAGQASTLTLPSSYRDGTYRIYNYAFSYAAGLRSVVIPAGVAVIGDGAFYGCEDLMTVTLGSGVTSIGYDAFAYCERLVEVINLSALELVAGEDTYGEIALNALLVHSGASRLAEQNGYVMIDDGAGNAFLLAYTGTESALTLPAGYNGGSYEIAPRAFAGNDAIESVVIPAGVTAVGAEAFYECEGLIRAVIGPDVVSIGKWAFRDCDFLTSVTLGESVTTVGEYAFQASTRLIEVINHSALSLTLESTNYGWVAQYALEIHTSESRVERVGEYLFYTDADGASYLTGYTGEAEELTLPASYNGGSYEIGPRAFYCNYELTAVVIPNGVTAIGKHAFDSNIYLTSVVISDSVESVGYKAFDSCYLLRSVTLGNGVESIGYYAFHNTAIRSILLPASLQTIDEGAFSGCYALVEIINRSSLSLSIGDDANGGVARYALRILGGNSPSYIDNVNGYQFYTDEYGDHYLIGYTGSETALVLPESYQNESYAIYPKAFVRAEMKSVYIPAGVTAVGSYAFQNCSYMESVVFAADSPITEIETVAFNSCYSLVSMVIPGGVTFIANAAFNQTYPDVIYYGGTATGWGNITVDVGNGSLDDATVYFYSATEPTGTGLYWHYDADGMPVVWE